MAAAGRGRWEGALGVKKKRARVFFLKMPKSPSAAPGATAAATAAGRGKKNA